ncbi:hypothetical protein CF326_g10047 [Tilletia indica]|nr:hypothetical protein CF326_g10047 [Tilletia indica]
MQSLTSLELTMSPYRFSEFTMESSMVISSRIFSNLLELKILGERTIEDKATRWSNTFCTLQMEASGFSLRQVDVEASAQALILARWKGDTPPEPMGIHWLFTGFSASHTATSIV